ncbi:uncharacterized protein LOC144877673 isoform X2 [Branchiostoma floridae x Branchiostoma japonicum]
MSRAELSDGDDGPGVLTRAQKKMKKKGGSTKEGTDTPSKGPSNDESHQRDDEEPQQEREAEISDVEDDHREGETDDRAEASKDTQKENVLDAEAAAHRDREVGDVMKMREMVNESNKLAVSSGGSDDLTVNKAEPTDLKKRQTGPASIKPDQSKELAFSQEGSEDQEVVKTESTDVGEKLIGSASVKPETASAPSRPDTSEQNVLGISVVVLCVGVFLVAVLIGTFLSTEHGENSALPVTDVNSYGDNAKTIESLSNNLQADFLKRLNALKKRFPSQDESLWSTLSDTLAPDSPTNPCSMLTLTSLVPSSSSPNARLTLTNLASTLPWLMEREHVTLHHHQFTTLKEEHAREAIEDVMGALSSDVIVIPDVDSMPFYVMDVVRTSCQSNEAQSGHVVVMTSEERPEKADSVVVAVLPERDTDGGASLERTPLENPDEGLDVIRKRFPAQTDRVWQVVGAAILSHIAEADPVKPAVVIIGAPPGAHSTADRLAKALARIYTVKPIAIDSRRFAPVNAARAKLHLDRVLESGLLGNDLRESGVIGGARAVVLTRLEALPGDAAMLFHGYCDHSEAPFKGAAYFFTVHCSDEIDPTLHYKEQERKVHQELKRAWRNLPATHLGPLLGRITPLTAVVTPERDMELSNE